MSGSSSDNDQDAQLIIRREIGTVIPRDIRRKGNHLYHLLGYVSNLEHFANIALEIKDPQRGAKRELQFENQYKIDLLKQAPLELVIQGFVSHTNDPWGEVRFILSFSKFAPEIKLSEEFLKNWFETVAPKRKTTRP